MINQSINARFVLHRYTTRPRAPIIVSSKHDQKVQSLSFDDVLSRSTPVNRVQSVELSGGVQPSLSDAMHSDIFKPHSTNDYRWRQWQQVQQHLHNEHTSQTYVVTNSSVISQIEWWAGSLWTTILHFMGRLPSSICAWSRVNKFPTKLLFSFHTKKFCKRLTSLTKLQFYF